MKFAINYSTQAAELLSEGKIEIDRFKTPNWPDLVKEAGNFRPVAVHFGLQAGSGQLKNSDWGPVERLLTETGTPYVNLHLSPKHEDYPGFPIETLNPDQFQQVVDNLNEDVRAVIKQFGPERVIAENVPYRGEAGKVLRPAAEPGVIRQILDATGLLPILAVKNGFYCFFTPLMATTTADNSHLDRMGIYISGPATAVVAAILLATRRIRARCSVNCSGLTWSQPIFRS